MLVSRIADDRAVRLSADDAKRLGLKQPDQAELGLAESQPQPALITDPAEREAAVERSPRFQDDCPSISGSTATTRMRAELP
ncbi:MAG: hypothetical protein JWP21_805 [Tardiphaga sp.]|nr:hypothetical protein [Tardiphaga sp.]